MIKLSMEECHILKYLQNTLKLIYYQHDDKPVAYVIYNVNDRETLWYKLIQGDNVITPELRVLWPNGKATCGFTIQYKGQSIKDDYYNHDTLSHMNLVIVPSEPGYFQPDFIPEKFRVFAGINTPELLIDDNKIAIPENNKTLTFGQWILMIGIVVIAVLLFWYLTSSIKNSSVSTNN